MKLFRFEILHITLIFVTVSIIGISAIVPLVLAFSIKEVYSNPYSSSSIPSVLQSPILQINSNSNSPSNNNNSEFDIVIRKGAGMPGVLNTFFSPPILHVKVGDTVKWINHDSVGHTATSMAFKSDLIMPPNTKHGSPVFSHTFNTPGTYAYFCAIHPYMSGVIYVDSQETQRTLVTSTQNKTIVDAKIEIPQNAAYEPNFGPAFIPSGAYVPLGSKVTWINKDYVPHTATSTEGLFDTNIINPGDSKSTVLTDREGTIAYYCKIHPWMQATLIVEPPS